MWWSGGRSPKNFQLSYGNINGKIQNSTVAICSYFTLLTKMYLTQIFHWRYKTLMNEVIITIHSLHVQCRWNFPRKVHNSSFFINSEIQESYMHLFKNIVFYLDLVLTILCTWAEMILHADWSHPIGLFLFAEQLPFSDCGSPLNPSAVVIKHLLVVFINRHVRPRIIIVINKGRPLIELNGLHFSC